MFDHVQKLVQLVPNKQQAKWEMNTRGCNLYRSPTPYPPSYRQANFDSWGVLKLTKAKERNLRETNFVS